MKRAAFPINQAHVTVFGVEENYSHHSWISLPGYSETHLCALFMCMSADLHFSREGRNSDDKYRLWSLLPCWESVVRATKTWGDGRCVGFQMASSSGLVLTSGLFE